MFPFVARGGGSCFASFTSIGMNTSCVHGKTANSKLACWGGTPRNARAMCCRAAATSNQSVRERVFSYAQHVQMHSWTPTLHNNELESLLEASNHASSHWKHIASTTPLKTKQPTKTPIQTTDMKIRDVSF